MSSELGKMYGVSVSRVVEFRELQINRRQKMDQGQGLAQGIPGTEVGHQRADLHWHRRNLQAIGLGRSRRQFDYTLTVHQNGSGSIVHIQLDHQNGTTPTVTFRGCVLNSVMYSPIRMQLLVFGTCNSAPQEEAERREGFSLELRFHIGRGVELNETFTHLSSLIPPESDTSSEEEDNFSPANINQDPAEAEMNPSPPSPQSTPQSDRD